jgi:hypothetical protein
VESRPRFDERRLAAWDAALLQELEEMREPSVP